ncbi:hypothetical protein AVEN_71632-1 [Araneus ventricosus]|uniref:Uncharacterized protein n=1 Tax=Araneus ventricosus TaxID=182803 RepID=A0A4Y2GFG3_ARAVE|nr:hypothetical protein AVEN_71632-1 [Araneus ventricosus]
MTAIFIEMSLHSKILYAYQQSCEHFLVQISLTVKLSDKRSLYVKLTSGFEYPPILPECGFVKVRTSHHWRFGFRDAVISSPFRIHRRALIAAISSICGFREAFIAKKRTSFYGNTQ